MLSIKQWSLDVTLCLQELAGLLFTVAPLAVAPPLAETPLTPLSTGDARAVAQLVHWTETTLYDLLPRISTLDFSFADSVYHAPGAVPASEYRSARAIARENTKLRAAGSKAPPTPFHSTTPMRVFMLDLLGQTWLKLVDVLGALPDSSLAQDAASLTFASISAALPDLAILCSGSGVVRDLHADVTRKAVVPEMEYYNTVLPENVAPNTLLSTLSLAQVAQCLQVLNFARMSVDFRGRITECIRVLALRVAVLVRTNPPTLSTQDVVRRQFTLLVGLLCIAGRVRSITNQQDIVIPQEQLPLVAGVSALLENASEDIRVTEALMIQFVNDVLRMMVSRWDKAIFVMYDDIGISEPAFIAPVMWRRTYSHVYAFLKDQTFSDMWRYENLAPQNRVVAGVYLFHLLYTTHHGGTPCFLEHHVRLEDPVTNGAPVIVVRGPTSQRLIGDHLPPAIVCVGNVFGVYYKETLHTADNDIVTLIYFFLRTLKEEGVYGLALDDDLAEIYRLCGITTQEEQEEAEKGDRREAKEILRILKS